MRDTCKRAYIIWNWVLVTNFSKPNYSFIYWHLIYVRYMKNSAMEQKSRATRWNTYTYSVYRVHSSSGFRFRMMNYDNIYTHRSCWLLTKKLNKGWRMYRERERSTTNSWRYWIIFRLLSVEDAKRIVAILSTIKNKTSHLLKQQPCWKNLGTDRKVCTARKMCTPAEEMVNLTQLAYHHFNTQRKYPAENNGRRLLATSIDTIINSDGN